MSLLGLALAAGLVWRALGLLGVVQERLLPAWAATFAMVLGTWELYRVVRSLAIVVRRRQRRGETRFCCLAPAMITNDAHDHLFGRVVDVSLSGIGLLVARPLEEGTRLQVGFSLPGLDGRDLPVTMTACVRSVREASSTEATQAARWRLGMAVAGIDSSSRDSLISFCYVAHPWERLRTSRLEARMTGSPPAILEAQPASPRDQSVTISEREAAG